MTKPQACDLILFQIENGIWTAAIHPILAQKLYANDYDNIKQSALKYAADWRYKNIKVWEEIDANESKYLLEE